MTETKGGFGPLFLFSGAMGVTLEGGRLLSLYHEAIGVRETAYRSGEF